MSRVYEDSGPSDIQLPEEDHHEMLPMGPMPPPPSAGNGELVALDVAAVGVIAYWHAQE